MNSVKNTERVAVVPARCTSYLSSLCSVFVYTVSYLPSWISRRLGVLITNSDMVREDKVTIAIFFPFFFSLPLNFQKIPDFFYLKLIPTLDIWLFVQKLLLRNL